MALTPAEIHNVVFKRPKPLKRGYDEDEVDEFLDQVEGELSRLIEENNDLKRQVRVLEASGSGSAAAAGAPDALMGAHTPGPDELAIDAPGDDRASADGTSADGTSAGTAETQVVGASSGAGATALPAGTTTDSAGAGDEPTGERRWEHPDDHVQALSVLALARETADKHLTAAGTEAERHRREAREEAAAARQQAHDDVERMILEARERAETLHGDASTKAETLQRDAEEKARTMTAEAERTHAEVLGDLETKRADLQGKIDALRRFESRFRERMHDYLEQQLRDLDEGEPLEPGDRPDGLDEPAATTDMAPHPDVQAGTDGEAVTPQATPSGSGGD
ncbi:MAG: DivIVA domain-containing protein [Mycobacteriales bacterium]